MALEDEIVERLERIEAAVERLATGVSSIDTVALDVGITQNEVREVRADVAELHERADAAGWPQAPADG